MSFSTRMPLEHIWRPKRIQYKALEGFRLKSPVIVSDPAKSEPGEGALRRITCAVLFQAEELFSRPIAAQARPDDEGAAYATPRFSDRSLRSRTWIDSMTISVTGHCTLIGPLSVSMLRSYSR